MYDNLYCLRSRTMRNISEYCTSVLSDMTKYCLSATAVS